MLCSEGVSYQESMPGIVSADMSAEAWCYQAAASSSFLCCDTFSAYICNDFWEHEARRQVRSEVQILNVPWAVTSMKSGLLVLVQAIHVQPPSPHQAVPPPPSSPAGAVCSCCILSS